MEAVEFEHAERIAAPRIRRSSIAMKREAVVADPQLLPRHKGIFWSDEAEIDWIEGRDLAAGNPVFVPFEVVHTDHRLPRTGPDAALKRSSSGLGAGNNRHEAIIAGLCELVERDAVRLWRLRDPFDRASRRLRLPGVKSDDCRELIDRYTSRGISVAVWDATTDVGVPCFICRVSETKRCTREPLGDSWSAG